MENWVSLGVDGIMGRITNDLCRTLENHIVRLKTESQQYHDQYLYLRAILAMAVGRSEGASYSNASSEDVFY